MTLAHLFLLRLGSFGFNHCKYDVYCLYQVLSFVSIFFICVSILSFCLSTYPDWQTARIYNRPVMYQQNLSVDSRNWTWTLDLDTMEAHLSFHFVDLVCGIWFSMELAFRLITCPRRKQFFFRFLNIIDVFATMSFYIDLVCWLNHLQNEIIYEHLGILRLIRILQLFKLARHSQDMKILLQTFRASGQELMLLAFFLAIFSFFFASLVYYAERIQVNPKNEFISIPHGLWWALVTMTTVGYGDLVPKTLPGMIVGALCALGGVITVALPVPFIVSHFEMYYSHTRVRAKMPKKRRGVVHVSEVRKNRKQQTQNNSKL